MTLATGLASSRTRPTDGHKGCARVSPASVCGRSVIGRTRDGERDVREGRGLLGELQGIPPGLGHHLDWFPWDGQERGPDADRVDTPSGQATTGGYDCARVDLAREP